MSKDKNNKKKKLSVRDKKRRNTKIAILGMVSIIGFSTVAGLISVLIPEKDTYAEYYNNVDLAFEQATEVNSNAIEEIINKQTNEKDYTLKTMIDILNTNPAYIAVGEDVKYEEGKVSKLISKLTNKKYNSDEIIELAWKTDNNKSITTYLATDITEDVNIIGLFVNDIDLSDSLISENDNIVKTEKTLADIKDLELPIELDIVEERMGDFYAYSIKYPLLYESEVVKAIMDEDNAAATIAQRMIRTNNSTIIAYTENNEVISINEALDSYDILEPIDNEVLNKINDTEDLTEDNFLETVGLETDKKQGTRLIGIEKTTHIHSDNESSSEENECDKAEGVSIQTKYIIQDEEGDIYNITFENGVKVDMVKW